MAERVRLILTKGATFQGVHRDERCTLLEGISPLSVTSFEKALKQGIVKVITAPACKKKSKKNQEEETGRNDE